MTVSVVKNDAASTATLSWTPPASDGASPITGYDVARDGVDTSGQGAWSHIYPGDRRSSTLTKLAPGNTYNLSVRAVNADGKGPPATVTVTMAVGTLTPGIPTIAGAAAVGSTLTASPGFWAPQPVTYTHQWHRAGTVIPDATGTTYTATPADTGQTLTVTVIGSKPGYTTTSRTSAATAAVVAGQEESANPVGLPALGFSLNGESLAGPINPAHYRTLARFTPAPVWARVGFSSDGDWRANVDKYVDAVRSAGMKVLLRASFPSKQWSGQVPLDVAAYGTFVGELAAHIKAKGLSPSDVVFEYPNEINSTRITGAQYARAAASAYPKLKEVNPAYRIIGASENVYKSNWKLWLEDTFAAGYARYSDGVSFHNYDIAGDHAKYTYLRGLMEKFGAGDEMVWLSEFGTSTPPRPSGATLGGQTPERQAQRIVANLKDLRDNFPWITHAFIYADVDIPSRQASDPFEANFGIYTMTPTWEAAPKPAVEAIKSLYLPD